MTRFKHYALPLIIAASLGLSSIASASGPVLATVNNKPITQQDYDAFVSENPQSVQAGKERIINELITRELVYQDALSKGLDKDRELQARLEAMRKEMMLGAALERAVSTPAISDAELKKIYENSLSEFDAREYKARHILVESRQEAEQLITELDMGGNFAELARQKSKDTGSGSQGGDLGWFSIQQMVPQFSEAVAQLEKGKYTKTPIETRFGWHVIQLEDSRTATPPAFEQIKPQLQGVAEQMRANEYLQSLKDKAKIEIR